MNIPERKLRECVLKARAKGVIFDVGHGQGSFSWEIAEICGENNFYPDVISSDLHSGNVTGLARDLPWVMSKFMHLGKHLILKPKVSNHHSGMEITDIVNAVTVLPCKVIGKDSQLLSDIDKGNVVPDLTVLKIENIEEIAEDCSGNSRILRKAFVPKYVVRKGVLKILE